jgi:hypothetical protein
LWTARRSEDGLGFGLDDFAAAAGAEIAFFGDALAQGAGGGVLGLALDDLVEHAQRLLVVALRGVDFGERDGGDRRRTLKIVLTFAVAANGGSGVRQIETGFDHAGE